jgi:hypothetical protein
MQDRKKFLALIQCLIHIAYFGDFKAEVTFKAKCLLENWCKFQNILLASIFTELFSLTTPTSEYLQKRELDYFTATQKIQTLALKLREKRYEFSSILIKTTEFVEHIQKELTKTNYSVEVESFLPAKRIPKSTLQFGETSSDETRTISSSPSKWFEINVFNVIIDTAIQQMNSRFVSNEALMKDIDCYIHHVLTKSICCKSYLKTLWIF